jgi:hypothetical protein
MGLMANQSLKPRRRRSVRLLAVAGAAAVATCVTLVIHAAPAVKPVPSTDPAAAEPVRVKPAKNPRATGEEIRFSETEKTTFELFMKANSPKKWETYQQMVARAPDRPRTQQLRNGLAIRFRELESIRVSDSQRHDFEVQAIRIEDDAYGVLQSLRTGRDPEQNESHLRQLASAFIDNRHSWRQVRIQRVKAELKSLDMKKAIAAMHEEEKEESAFKKGREEQIHQLVNKWKNGTNPPKLKPPLPGTERPIGESPATEPASATEK